LLRLQAGVLGIYLYTIHPRGLNHRGRRVYFADSLPPAQITVQADRTATVNPALKLGQTTTSVEAEASPLMNAADATVGYVLNGTEIAARR
jgi:hypothetical protein